MNLKKIDMQSLSGNILLHYNETFIEKYFNGVGGIRLRYVEQKQIATADALIILGGRTEFAEKYAELFFDFRHLNLAVYSYDHRGQGLSERILSEHNKGHVEYFDDYSEDLKIFIDTVVSKGKHRRIFVLCHSMGGAVTARFLIKYQGVIDGVIFSAPMFGINTSPISQNLTEGIIGLLVKLGFRHRYIFGGRPNSWDINFEGNPLTSCKKRFERNLSFFQNNSQLELGSPTLNWLKESMAAARDVLIKSASGAIEEIPMLLLQGEKDKVVTAAAQNEVSRNIPSCSKHIIDDARHELLMEDDHIRNEVLAIIKNFLEQHCSA